MAKKGVSIRKEDLRNYGNFMNTMRKLYHFEQGTYASEQFQELWSKLNESGNVSQSQYEKAMKETIANIQSEDTPRIKAEARKLDASFFREENLNPRTAKALKRKK